MPGSRSGRGLTIGVVGPHDLVERIAGVGAAMERGPWRLRLTCLGYDEEHEVVTLLQKQADDLDALLFAGPLPHDLAEQAGVVHAPAALLPLSGAALYSTLLRAVLDRDIDVTKVSIDSLSRPEVVDAYGDLGVSGRSVRVMPYDGSASVGRFAEFHRKLHARGTTQLALTTVRSVAERLDDAGVPVMRMAPTSATIRSGLNHAVLMGLGSQLEGAQTAICIVELMSSTDSRPSSEYWQEDLRLAAHRLLLQDARPMGAKVLVRDPHSYLIATTLGPLVEATEDFTVPPFLDRLRRELGVEAKLGIGLGRTVHDAERNAQVALAEAVDDADQTIPVIGPYGPSRLFTGRQERLEPADTETGAQAMFDQLVSVLERDGVDWTISAVVDAEQVARALDVTPRSARRALQRMTNGGLVWPVPPQRSQGRGRPRQRFRLVPPEEKRA